MLDSHPALTSTLVYAPQNWRDLRSRRITSDGDYLILGAGHREHRLWLPGPPVPDASLSALIPVDKSAPTRSAATLRFLRDIDGGSSAGAAQIHDKRISEMLRALDGHLAKASYRAIAQQLFGHERLNREPWKTSSLRAMTIRLVRGGIGLMRGGYRKLLTR
ncbi:Uncharacterized protein BN69_0133 [Methylocystis sp. SC2]|nr:DUF2285 domain-containing protein [Methylocystis sp. SC2]CCJ05584.1 Uncharacterized protein BN69_0133 [Methylocystis sp. SC2]